MNPVLDLSSRLRVLPIIYGSGDFAMETRRRLQIMKPDCIAVALPPSFADAVEEGIARLPQISLAIQREISLEGDYNCVPIDPCQGVIAIYLDFVFFYFNDVERMFSSITEFRHKLHSNRDLLISGKRLSLNLHFKVG